MSLFQDENTNQTLLVSNIIDRTLTKPDSSESVAYDCKFSPSDYKKLSIINDENLQYQPQSIHMVDDNVTTCFGFNDRLIQTDLATFGLNLISNHSNLVVIMDASSNCSVFANGIIFSAMQKSASCRINKQCRLVKHETTTCTLECPCQDLPCKIHIMFLPMLNTIVCELFSHL